MARKVGRPPKEGAIKFQMRIGKEAQKHLDFLVKRFSMNKTEIIEKLLREGCDVVKARDSKKAK